MIDLSTLSIAVGGGVLASGLFLAGLWLTVRRLPETEHPGLFAFAAMMLRLAAVASVFYLVARTGSWIAVLVALLVFVAVRTVVTRKVRGLHGS